MSTKSISRKVKYEIVVFAIAFIALLSLTIFISSQHLFAHQDLNKPKIVDCQVLGKTHFVYIKDNRFYPRHVDAKLCDIITIVNHDNYRSIAFGKHDEHITYNGFYEEPLKTDSSLSVVLNQSGNYMYHDHLQDYVYGTFSVSK